MKKNFFFFGFVLVIFYFLLFAALPAHAYIVYPGDPNWHAELRGSGGSVSITTENPRSGNGSLALATSGSLNDWAFFTRYADNDNWGYLSNVSDLSFDWFRQTAIDTNYLDYDPWNHQTPVLRLLIRDYSDQGAFFSELVWEKYYTDSSSPVLINEWVSQDLNGQNLWRYVSGAGYTISSGANIDPFGTNILMAETVFTWASNSGGISPDLPYTDQAVVYGLSVGVGSAWPGAYKGFVDNVLLSFNSNGTVLNDNFEAPVPLPSTLLLLGSGMAILGAGRRWIVKGRQV